MVKIKILLKNLYFGITGRILRRKAFFTRKKTLVIIRLDAIGDYILFRNFLKILKQSERFREYKITLCGNAIWRDIAEKYDKECIHEFIWIDKSRFSKGSEWIYSSLQQLKLHFKGFEILIQPNDMSSKIIEKIVSSCGAKFKITHNNDSPISFGVNGVHLESIPDEYRKLNPDSVFQFYRNKTFIEDIIYKKIEIEKPFFEPSKLFKDNYIVIFPGARDDRRKWSADNFAELCKRIREISDLKILICGDGDDFTIAEKIIQKSGIEKIENKAGRTRLSELVEIISKAQLVVSNETCAVHIGASVNTTTICISNGNHFGRFNPYPEKMAPFIKTVYPEEIKIDPENYAEQVKKYFISSYIDINTINADKVFKIVSGILNKKMVENIKHNENLLAIILRNNIKGQGIEFFTPYDLSQQLAFMHHPAGKIIEPHVHKPLSREVRFTQEVLFLKRGKLRVDFYDDNQKYLESRVLEEGDTILLATGGHGFEVLEEIEMIEVKQGPYSGEQEKTRFKGIQIEKVIVK